MPYVPSKKTDGKSQDREILDAVVEKLATSATGRISKNLSLISVYKSVFVSVAHSLHLLLRDQSIGNSLEDDLAQAIYDIGAGYKYEGAYMGEFNYAFTRFIQRVPQLKVQAGSWEKELRYWISAGTVEALIYASHRTKDLDIGVSGVFEDIKDEYKRRVNTAYEAEQILKSGDCYDTPYYNRLMQLVDENNKSIGYFLVDMDRSEATVSQDLLGYQLVAKKREESKNA